MNIQRFSKLPLLLTLAIAALVSAPIISHAAQYDSYGDVTLIDGGTNNVAKGATNTYSGSIVSTKQAEVGIFVQTRTDQTNYVNLNLQISRSVDGVNFDTINPILVTIAGSTNAGDLGFISLATNIVTGGVGYLRLDAVGNVDTIGALTNLTVKYGIKR